MSRGRRLETGGMGALGGVLLATISPALGLVYAFGLIGFGLLLQVRAERRRGVLPDRVEIVKDGQRLEGREREEALMEHGRLLVWEAAGRPGLPEDDAG